MLLKIDFKLKKSSLSNYIVFDYEFLSTSVIAVDLLGIYMYGLITVYTCCKLFYVRYVSHCHCPIQELIFTGRGNMLLNFNTRKYVYLACHIGASQVFAGSIQYSQLKIDIFHWNTYPFCFIFKSKILIHNLIWLFVCLFCILFANSCIYNFHIVNYEYNGWEFYKMQYVLWEEDY